MLSPVCLTQEYQSGGLKNVGPEEDVVDGPEKFALSAQREAMEPSGAELGVAAACWNSFGRCSPDFENRDQSKLK